MKLSAEYLHDYQQFHIRCAEDGRSLADEGCTCWQNAPCYQCAHPGNPRGIDEPECWASERDYREFQELLGATSAFLAPKGLAMSGAKRHEYLRRWIGYNGRAIYLGWDADENAPLFRATGRDVYRSGFYSTVESAFVAAELAEWGLAG